MQYNCLHLYTTYWLTFEYWVILFVYYVLIYIYKFNYFTYVYYH